MKRTQEEIRQFCDEINANVRKVVQKEDMRRAIRKATSHLAKNPDRIISPVGLVMTMHALYAKEILDRHPDTKKKIMECMKEQERL